MKCMIHGWVNVWCLLDAVVKYQSDEVLSCSEQNVKKSSSLNVAYFYRFYAIDLRNA